MQLLSSPGIWPLVAMATGSPDRSEARRRGRELASQLLAEWTEAPAGTEIIAICPDCGGKHGRPTLVVDGRELEAQVSIAHSGRFTVAALHPHQRIGIDLEQHTGDPARLAAITDVTGVDCDDPLQHWTMVEAVLKAHGDGLRIDPSLVLVTGSDERRVAVIDGLTGTYAVATIPADGLAIAIAMPES